jgi:hypothetical protein
VIKWVLNHNILIADDLTKLIEDSKTKCSKPVFAMVESFGIMVAMHHHTLANPVGNGYILCGPVQYATFYEEKTSS